MSDISLSGNSCGSYLLPPYPVRPLPRIYGMQQSSSSRLTMIAQLREHEEAFQVKEAALPAIGLGDREYARVPSKETAIKLLFWIDETHEAYQIAELKSASLLHFLKTDCEKAWKRAQSAGHQHHKLLGWNPFQSGGSFVFSPATSSGLHTTARRLEITLLLRRC